MANKIYKGTVKSVPKSVASPIVLTSDDHEYITCDKCDADRDLEAGDKVTYEVKQGHMYFFGPSLFAVNARKD